MEWHDKHLSALIICFPIRLRAYISQSNNSTSVCIVMKAAVVDHKLHRMPTLSFTVRSQLLVLNFISKWRSNSYLKPLSWRWRFFKRLNTCTFLGTWMVTQSLTLFKIHQETGGKVLIPSLSDIIGVECLNFKPWDRVVVFREFLSRCSGHSFFVKTNVSSFHRPG